MSHPTARLPTALAAPAGTWRKRVDVLILGSGAAGLAAGLAARPERSVLLVTKDVLSAGSTAWAQGGLAAVLDPGDSIEEHVRDTLEAGAGLCDEAVVRDLCAAAPAAIHQLIALGARFDPAADGAGPALTREGGHSRNRIVHSQGDKSGAEVQRTLDQAAVLAGVQVMDHAFALDLIVGRDAAGDPQVTGARIALTDETGRVVSTGVVHARAVVMATGGFGQVFASTSNPPAVTGDGVAMCLRAGLPVADVEFVQFHPTVLWLSAEARGQQPLISEAVRGEGAVLRTVDGERIMPGVHPLEDMAPRDVVAAAISAAMARSTGPGRDHVMLDATHMGARFAERFPGITEACLAAGIDPAKDWIPVAPAAHYACGGVVADLHGRTATTGLFCVGETACTGLHGANRLASNSLTESVVGGIRVGIALADELPGRPSDAGAPPEGDGAMCTPDDVATVRAAMSRHVGVMRTPDGLAEATRVLDGVADAATAEVEPSRAAWEATNVLTVARAIVLSALTREESRGCHRRTDVDGPRDEWHHHIRLVMDPSGALAAPAVADSVAP